MTQNDMLWAQISESLRRYVGDIRRTTALQESVNTFSNMLIDLVIVDVEADGGSGKGLVARLRGAESGLARKVPVVGMADPDKPEQLEALAMGGFDVNLYLPYDENVLRAHVSSFFM